MGKGSRKRRQRAPRTATESWYASEAEEILDIPGMECRQCGGLLFSMSLPIAHARCNDCGWQGALMQQAPDGTITTVSDWGTCPVERVDDLHTVIHTAKGPMTVVSHNRAAFTVEHENGQITYDFEGHLLEATGSMAIYGMNATRPPRCPECGERWVRWVKPPNDRETLARKAKELDVEFYATPCQGRPWHFVHGYGGRVYECLVCGHTNSVPTTWEGGPQTPSDPDTWFEEPR